MTPPSGLAVDGTILLVTANRFVDFIAMNRDFLGGFHPQANFVATDFHHDDRNVIVDDNTLVLLPR